MPEVKPQRPTSRKEQAIRQEMEWNAQGLKITIFITIQTTTDLEPYAKAR